MADMSITPLLPQGVPERSSSIGLDEQQGVDHALSFPLPSTNSKVMIG